MNERCRPWLESNRLLSVGLLVLIAAEQCLFREPEVISYAEADADYVGLAAPGGGVGVTLAQNHVTLGFERNAGDATDALRAANAVGAKTSSKLHADNNVYVSWDYTPTSAETNAVEKCLQGGMQARLPNKYPPTYIATVANNCRSAAQNTGLGAEVARSGCSCLVNQLQARYTQTQSATLTVAAMRSLESVCRSAIRGARSAAPLRPLRLATTGAEGRAILAELHASRDAGPRARLTQLTGARTDSSWAFAVIDTGPNTQGAGALMHKARGQWRLIILGSEFSCRDMPPPAIKAELQLSCQQN